MQKRNIMVILLVLIISVTFCNGQENANVTYEGDCNKVGDILTIKAVYTGNGIPISVSWFYSGDVGSFLEIQTSNCAVFGSVPVGFPIETRLSYECVTTDPSLPSNTYKLKVSGLLSNETDKTWSVTFSPPIGATPAAVELGVPTICTSCKCECDCMCRTIVIVSMVFGIPGALGLLIVIVGLVTGCFDEKKTTLLVFDGIGIVSDVLSLILSIVVKVKECCEENCECCEEDSECCNDWIDNAAIAFIVIPCVVGLISVVIFVLVKLDIIGPGRNAYKAKEAKEPGENHGMTGTSM